MAKHNFGGDWTAAKLQVLRLYLEKYNAIFSKPESKASYFHTIYIDAFAGTGYIAASSDNDDPEDSLGLFPEFAKEHEEFLKGSATLALDLEPGFSEYIFIDKKTEHVQDLEKLRDDYPTKAMRISVIQGDANSVLMDIVNNTNWQKSRAVVFLDPYGMAVDWSTIKALAMTKAVDVFVLFPLGQAVNRMLTRSGRLSKGWESKLTKFFGGEDWKLAFYTPVVEPTLFGDQPEEKKIATFESIGRFFVERLKSIFVEVATNPLQLRNSTGTPLYLLCFAAANEKGAPIARRIAESTMKN